MALRISSSTVWLAAIVVVVTVICAQAQQPPAANDPRLVQRDALWLEASNLWLDGKLDEAIAKTGEVLLIDRQLYGPNSEAALQTLGFIGRFECDRNDFAAARARWREVLDGATQHLGPDSWLITEARLWLTQVDQIEKLPAADRQRLLEADRLSQEAQNLSDGKEKTPAIAAAQKALEIYDSISVADPRKVAAIITQLADLYNLQGDHAKAVPLCRRALAIYEKIWGPEQGITIGVVNKLVDAYEALEDYEAAVPLFQRLLAYYEKTNGPEHPYTATILSRLGIVYRDQGKYDLAVPLLRRCVAIREKAIGPETAPTASALRSLGYTLYWQEKYAEALPLYQRELAIREKVLGPEHTDTAIACYDLASTYTKLENYAEALPLFKRALAIDEKAYGPDDAWIAVRLSDLASCYDTQGNYAAALPLYQRALAIREKALSPDDTRTATSLNDVAIVYTLQQEDAEALPLYQRALAIWEKARATTGREHAGMATTLKNLGEIYRSQADYAQATLLLKRALAVRERVSGPDDPATASCLYSLGEVYLVQGDRDQALLVFERALAIWKQTFGPESRPVATGLNGVARVYETWKDYDEARPLLEQALAIREKADGPDALLTATSLNNLGANYEFQKDYDKALPLLDRARAIYEKVLGPDHPLTATGFNNVAEVYREQGKFDQALPLYRRALAAKEKAFPPQHPEVALARSNLAFVYWAQGKHRDALPLMEQALTMTRRLVDLTADAQSERQQLAMSRSLRTYLDNYLSLLLDSDGDVAAAYDNVLAWKGAILARQRLARQARSAADPRLAEALKDLQATSDQLARLALAAPPENERDAWQRQITALGGKREDLEVRLSGLSAGFRREQAARASTGDNLRKILPQDAALVDFLEYWHASPPAAGKGPLDFEQRVVAFVVRPEQAIQVVGLGSADTIGEAVEHWREMNGTGATGPKLRELVWQPLAKHLAGVQTVLVSPDGALAEVPLTALPASQPGKYLIEEVALVVVPVPQMLSELLAEKPSAGPPSSLLLAGDIDYGGDPGESRNLLAQRAATDHTRDGRPLKFARLEAAQGELSSIRDWYEQAVDQGEVAVLRRRGATEAAFRAKAPTHAWIHVITHGFFAVPDDDEPTDRGGAASDSAEENPPTDPGLLSGLALAGAATPPADGKDDGILTALEVSALDLSKVDTVVLSACETGLGQAAGGEGLLGLERSFQVAGAKTVVASLWKVPDAATSRLMQRFYENMWDRKLGKLAALREAQIFVMHDQGSRGLLVEKDLSAEVRALPPFYWAAFVLSGDWR